MTLLHPFWLLSLIALPLMAALYLLKVRPSQKPSNAYFLWQQIYQAKSSSAFFRRLRDLWSLLCMLLALLCICMALTEPVFTGDDDRDLILILDTTASMQAYEGGVTRLERAKTEAEHLIRSMNGSQQAAILSLSDDLYFHAHLTRSPRELLRALQEIEGSELPFQTEVLAALDNGQTVIEPRAQPVSDAELVMKHPYRIVLITDGNASLDALPEVIEPLVLDISAARNVGIVAADVQWLPGRGAAAWYFRVLNAGTSEMHFDLELEHMQSGHLAKLVPLRIPAGEESEVLFELEGVTSGHWRARLLIEDALLLDNEVVLGLNPRRPILVGIDAANAWFFQNCVQAFGRSGGALQIATDGDTADLHLVEGRVGHMAANTVVFKPTGDSPYWVSLGEPVGVSLAEVVTEGHPFLEHLDLEGVVFRGAREIELPAGALVLVASDQGIPLFYTVSVNGRSALVANFDPGASDFYLSPWFPVVVHSAALHLVGREETVNSVLPTGTRIKLADSESIRWLPDEVPITGAGRQVALKRQGAYQMETESSTLQLGVGLLTEVESALSERTGQTVAALAGGWPIRWCLLLLAFVILVLECILYHRRKLG